MGIGKRITPDDDKKAGEEINVSRKPKSRLLNSYRRSRVGRSMK